MLKSLISSKLSIIGETCSLLLHVSGTCSEDTGGLGFGSMILWLVDIDNIGHEFHGSIWHFLSDIGHDLYLKTKNTLSHQDVSNGGIKEFFLWLTGGDQITLGVFLGLCSLTSDFTSNENLATSGILSHDCVHDTVDGHSYWFT